MTSWFFDRMQGFGAADAIVFNGTTYSYADLVARVEQWTRTLDEQGVAADEVVALEGATSIAACAGLLALVARGAVVVPLAPLPEAKRTEFHEVAEVERVITLDPATQLPSITTTGRRADNEFYRTLRARRTPGLVLFSSGTTGRSKATVLDFAALLANYGPPTRPRRTAGFLNLDHIGGINTLLHTLSQGGALITLGTRSPAAVCADVARYAIEVLPTTPTFLNMMLISGSHQRHDLSSLRLITYGTEPMPQGVLERLSTALPKVRFKQTYGLSELGIMPTKSRADDSLWVKLGGEGFDYEIRDGLLWIRSDMAMLGYLNAAAPFDERGYFNTQDMVETDGEWVRILGRASEIINVAGEKVFPSEVENVLLELPFVLDATVSGRRSHVTGHVVMATLKLDAPADRREVTRAVQEHCRARLEPFKVPVVVEISDADQHSVRYKKMRNAA